MSCTHIFAFSALSPISQLSLASHMTFSSLLDFAASSPQFHIYLRTHCTEVVLAALRTQHNYTPQHLPRRHLPTSPSTSLLPLHSLYEEELLPPLGRKILALLPDIAGRAGVRGLLRYTHRYAAVRGSREKMKRWLQERYTADGIREIWDVVDALYRHIDGLLPSLRGDPRREQLQGVLVCGLEVLWLPSGVGEERVLRVLEDRGIIEGCPWRVWDGERGWFEGPAGEVLEEEGRGEGMEKMEKRKKVEEDWEEEMEMEQVGVPCFWWDVGSVTLMMAAGVAAREKRDTGRRGFRGCAERGRFVGEGGGWSGSAGLCAVESR